MILADNGRLLPSDEEHTQIVDAVQRLYTPILVAKAVRIPESIVLGWMKYGKEECENGQNTPCARLYLDFNFEVARLCETLIERMKNGSRNVTSSQQLLQVIAREDFGRESLDMKELIDLYKKLVDDLKSLKENSIQGVLTHAKADDEGTEQDTSEEICTT